MRRRGGFSDRQKIKTENTTIQFLELDDYSRIKLLNFLSESMVEFYDGNGYFDEEFQAFFRYVLSDIYLQPVRAKNRYIKDLIVLLEDTFKNDTYDAVLTAFEGIIQYWEQCFQYDNSYAFEEEKSESLYKMANGLFEREYIGYRFINGILSPISDTLEIDAINELLDNNKYEVVREHIDKALGLLSDRNNPDYENSIKESISAVESICCIITNTSGKSATLGNTLKKLKAEGLEIHPALEEAYQKLYGFTSDAGGIRHSKGLSDSGTSFAEAKYMLVSCTAFINYLMDVMAD